MRVLVSGGIFRLSLQERARRQPAPEILLVEGLRARGLDVVERPLEDLRTPSFDRSFDIVHIHHLSKAALAAALSPLSRPMLFTEHGIPSDPSRQLQFARRTIFRRASGIICLSEHERDLKTRQFNLRPESTWVVPNPATLAEFSPHVRTPPSGRLRLLYVGQLIRLKQVDRIITALPRLPPGVTLRVVFHNDELLPELVNQARELGVSNRVEFAGQLSGTALRDAYLDADVLLLPSAHEALPSVVSEAILTALPVIASNVGGIPKQVGDAGILVSPDAHSPLDISINQLMADYESFALAAFARSAHLAEQLSPDASIDAHISVYDHLLNHGQRSQGLG